MYIIGNHRDGHWRIDLDGGELGDSLLLTEGRILLAIYCSNAEDSSILVYPAVHVGNEVS